MLKKVKKKNLDHDKSVADINITSLAELIIVVTVDSPTISFVYF